MAEPESSGMASGANGVLRVVLADDDVLLRSGLARLLERPGFSVVGEAGDAETLLALVRSLVPDVVVIDIEAFIDSLGRVAHGGSVVDPGLVQELFSARRRNDPLTALSPREQEVLALMAEGRSNLGIAQALWVTEGTVEKHVRSILGKLNLPEESTDHRRVLAVVAYLEAR